MALKLLPVIDFEVGSNGGATGSPRAIKGDFGALGCLRDQEHNWCFPLFSHLQAAIREETERASRSKSVSKAGVPGRI